jgi:hypothetical protein
MTRKSRARLDRDQQGIPRQDKIAHVEVDRKSKTQFILTNDMLVNQIQREGLRIARSFDKLNHASFDTIVCKPSIPGRQAVL